MSANTVRTFEWPTIDENTHVETGMRVKSQPSNYRWALSKSDYAKDTAKRVDWAKSDTHPDGVRMLAWPVDINPENGYVTIGDDEAIKVFDRDKGFLMLKIVSKMSGDYFVVPARYRNSGGCYDFDHVSPQRDNGDWVYSIPVHNLVPSDKKEGRKMFFLFLMRLTKNEAGNFVLKLERLEVTRGKHHYRLAIEKLGEFVGTEKSLPDLLEKKEQLYDIPVYPALLKYNEFKAR